MSLVRMLVVGSCTGRKSVTYGRMLTVSRTRAPQLGFAAARRNTG